MSTSFRDQAACILCRIALAYTIGELLIGRVELNTPLHSLISIREGLFWKQVGRSPYTASVFRGPPLLLQLCQLTAKRLVWQASVLSLVDWITGCVLERVVDQAVRLRKHDNAGTLGCLGLPFAVLRRVAKVTLQTNSLHTAEHIYIKQSAKFLYLVNPFLILSTAAGCPANLANLSVITALYGGLSGNVALAGLGLALGFYLSAHPALLLVWIHEWNMSAWKLLQHVTCELDSMPCRSRSQHFCFFLSKTAIMARRHHAPSGHLAARPPTRNSCNSLTCLRWTKVFSSLCGNGIIHTLCCSFYFLLHSSLWACFFYQTCS